LLVVFGYPFQLKRKGSELLYDMSCSKLSDKGEAIEKPLTDCLLPLIAELMENHVISWVSVR
jgi:hypothetical protein